MMILKYIKMIFASKNVENMLEKIFVSLQIALWITYG